MSKSRNDGKAKFVRLEAFVGNSVMFRCYVTIWPSSAFILEGTPSAVCNNKHWFCFISVSSTVWGWTQGMGGWYGVGWDQINTWKMQTICGDHYTSPTPSYY